MKYIQLSPALPEQEQNIGLSEGIQSGDDNEAADKEVDNSMGTCSSSTSRSSLHSTSRSLLNLSITAMSKSKRQKLKMQNDDMLQVLSERMKATDRVEKKLEEVLSGLNDAKHAFGNWLMAEVVRLPDHFWPNFRRDAFNLLASYQERAKVDESVNQRQHFATLQPCHQQPSSVSSDEYQQPWTNAHNQQHWSASNAQEPMPQPTEIPFQQQPRSPQQFPTSICPQQQTHRQDRGFADLSSTWSSASPESPAVGLVMARDSRPSSK